MMETQDQQIHDDPAITSITINPDIQVTKTVIVGDEDGFVGETDLIDYTISHQHR